MSNENKLLGVSATNFAAIDLNEFGPPGVVTSLMVVAKFEHDSGDDETRLHDRSERTFEVATLLNDHLKPGAISGKLDPNNGTSLLRLPEQVSKMQIAARSGTFFVEANTLGRIAKIYMSVTARSSAEAMAKFFSTITPFLDHLSFLFSVPLRTSIVNTADNKNHIQVVHFTVPDREQSIGNFAANLHPELAPVYALYREAKNSESVF